MAILKDLIVHGAARILGDLNISGGVKSNGLDLTTGIPYCVCDTAAGTKEKVGTVSGISSLKVGQAIAVRFTYKNSSSAATFNLNGFGAKPIVQYGTTAASTSSAIGGWYEGSVVHMIYDGTSWVFARGYNANDNTQFRAYVPRSGAVELPLVAGDVGGAAASWTEPSAGSYSTVYGAIAMDTTKRATLNPSTGKVTFNGDVEFNGGVSGAPIATTSENGLMPMNEYISDAELTALGNAVSAIPV